MSKRAAQDRFTTHSHRLIHLFGYLLVLAVVLRRRYDLSGSFTIGLALFLVGLFTVLYASEAILSRRVKSIQRFYFILQMIIVQSLGLFREYQDTWAVLYIALGFQVAVRIIPPLVVSSCSAMRGARSIESCFDGMVSRHFCG